MDESDRARRTNLLATLVAVGAALAVAAACFFARLSCFHCGLTAWDSEADGHRRVMVAESVQVYALRKDRLPTAAEGLAVAYGAERIPTDRWGRPYVYVPIDLATGRFEIVSYAADGEPGGTGQDEDLRYSDVATWRTEPSP